MLASALTSLPNSPALIRSRIQRKWLSRRRWYPKASTTPAFRQASVIARPSETELAIGLSRKTCLRSEEHTSELQSLTNLVCRLLLEKKKKTKDKIITSIKTEHNNCH